MNQTSPVGTAASVVIAVIGIGLTVGSLIAHAWWQAALCALLAASGIGSLVTRRRAMAAQRRSAEAAAEWSDDALRELVAAEPDRIHAVRRLRQADRRLNLSDALRLVDSHSPE